jgi:hypothetical protein
MADYRATNPRAALVASTSTFCARAAFDAPDLRQAIEHTRPDAVIVDVNSWGRLPPRKRGAARGRFSARIRCRYRPSTHRRSGRA